MRIANLVGRATLVTDHGLLDVASSSDGAFSASIEKCLGQLDALGAWLASVEPVPNDPTTPEQLYGDPRLGLIVERPPQIFAVGLNYRRHAEELNLELPSEPMIFTKFVSSLAHANACVRLPSETTDFEAELVVIVGRNARKLKVSDALSIVAGYCVGQDFSERTQQLKGTLAQFSLGKSFQNFTPLGPWLTTADEITDPNDLSISCSVNGTQYQNSRTSDMVFSVAEILSYLSNIVELRRGDVILTGSPHGAGYGQSPPMFLQPGDRVVTEIEGLGRIENVMT